MKNGYRLRTFAGLIDMQVFAAKHTVVFFIILVKRQDVKKKLTHFHNKFKKFSSLGY